MLLISYRIANWLYRHHFPVLPKLMYYIQRALFKSSLPATCTIGVDTKLGYVEVAFDTDGGNEIESIQLPSVENPGGMKFLLLEIMWKSVLVLEYLGRCISVTMLSLERTRLS